MSRQIQIILPDHPPYTRGQNDFRWIESSLGSVAGVSPSNWPCTPEEMLHRLRDLADNIESNLKDR
jgi:hypothetical protein